MKLVYLSFFALLSLIGNPLTDTIDKVAELIGKGNTSELGKYFADDIEITLANEENIYSKAQAGIILQRFFVQNVPAGSKILHKVNSNANYGFGVIILSTNNGPYRIAFTMKQVNNEMKLIELRIEKDKGTVD